MSVEFSVYNTPQPKDRKGIALNHARLLTSGTRKMDHICSLVSQFTTLSSADIKAVLEALSKYMILEMKNGYNVELEGIGHFSVALNSKQTVRENGKEMVSVSIDGINFRCSTKLKEGIQEGELKRRKIKKRNIRRQNAKNEC